MLDRHGINNHIGFEEAGLSCFVFQVATKQERNMQGKTRKFIVD